jgi:hypothetical protein
MARIERAFDAHAMKLVEVLCADLSFDPSNAPEYVANYHRGLANMAVAHKLAIVEVDKVYPE